MLDPKFVRRGPFLVFMILFLDVIGIAIIMPMLPAYLEQLTGDSVNVAALVGGGARAVVPPGVATRTSTAPTACAGRVTRRVVADTRVTDDAGVVPNRTSDARARLVPVSVRVEPPPVPPEAGDTRLRVGTAS